MGEAITRREFITGLGAAGLLAVVGTSEKKTSAQIYAETEAALESGTARVRRLNDIIAEVLRGERRKATIYLQFTQASRTIDTEYASLSRRLQRIKKRLASAERNGDGQTPREELLAIQQSAADLEVLLDNLDI